ncbi:hypothetical protein ACFPT7_16895 [Acidicapsa dinghuensis]|uniref:VWA domain-containing protein n=1 Tax=Acidicapsa dinghuensis TaxID=2218256 RepID=A0ABW1EJ26_9BACT|nr:hypothetical protein [Acidicapsa dinghuensis]
MEEIRGNALVLLRTVLVFIAAAVLRAPIWAQAAPASLPLIGASSNLVLTPVLVRSASGDMVSGLSAGDFRVTDNGQPQKIQADHVDMDRVALVVVMQVGSRVPMQLQSYQTLTGLVSAMFGSSIPHVALVTFDSHIEETWNFPDRFDGLKYAFRNPGSGDAGAAVIDALNGAAGLLKAQPIGLRRVILLLSQPQDEHSLITPAAVARQLGENNITVYSMAFKPRTSNRIHKQKRPKKEKMSPASDEATYAKAEFDRIVSRLQTDTSAESADLTGGEHIWLDDADLLQNVLATLRTDFANTYLLSFYPDSSQPGFHSIHVQLKKKLSENTLVARQAYWRDSN